MIPLRRPWKRLPRKLFLGRRGLADLFHLGKFSFQFGCGGFLAFHRAPGLFEKFKQGHFETLFGLEEGQEFFDGPVVFQLPERFLQVGADLGVDLLFPLDALTLLVGAALLVVRRFVGGVGTPFFDLHAPGGGGQVLFEFRDLGVGGGDCSGERDLAGQELLTFAADFGQFTGEGGFGRNGLGRLTLFSVLQDTRGFVPRDAVAPGDPDEHGAGLRVREGFALQKGPRVVREDARHVEITLFPGDPPKDLGPKIGGSGPVFL